MTGLTQFTTPLLLAAVLSFRIASVAHGSTPLVDPPRLPASGERTATVTITEPGRYAISAASGTGTALRVVDRLAGPGEIAGRAGERDGRLDLLLDRGTYRLVTLGAERAAGEVRLEVRPFLELSAPQPPLLVEGKPLSSTLQDFEQRSWWLRIDTARRVILEVAGRNLTDLRLFRDGGWLIDAVPAHETIEPEPGRPLRACRIVARLEPGIYLLTAFGGPDEPWPAGGKEHPLHLRFGIPSLGDTGRTRYRVGPFGADHFVVPGAVNFLQLELPEAAAARLTEAPFPAEGNPFGETRAAAAITKKHREPAAALEPAAQSGPRLITVRAAAGQPYVLQHFELRDRYSFQRSGRYWLGSVHSGHPQDSADATALVTVSGGAARRGLEPFLSQTIEIDAAHGWARRCNLLDTVTVFFRARAAGDYEVLLRGSAARVRFEPFLVTRPPNYREPALKAGGTTWRLEAGWHVLTIVPDEPGIVEAAVRPVGRLDAIWDLLAPDRPLRGEPVRPAVTFPAVDLEWDNTYTVHLNTRPGVRNGLVLRELPIDLVRPLPLALRPGEEIAVAARVPEAGTIRAEGETGENLELRSGAGTWLKALATEAATLELRVRNTGDATVLAALRFDASRLDENAPLPELPQPPTPPQFPALTAGAPRFFDLERGGATTFTVRAAEAAFHTLESTGLLATGGTLRSRYLPALAGASGGGTGRNFLVGSYLRAGEYQLTVSARGASRGHLGVRLRRAALRDGGTLRAGSPSRVTVGAAEGVVHEFEIVTAGTYRLEAAAAGRPLPCRLEDADGWPIETPGIPTLFKRRFEPGRYRLLLLPEAVGSRRVTLLDRVGDPPRLEGHGPHPLALDVTAGHTWVEPAADTARTPDRWEFALPAPATLRVTLTGEMQGEIRRRADAPGGEPLVRIQPGQGWSGRLPAGAYTLATVCSRRNNHAPYELAISADELVPGTSRAVTAPAVVPVSVENTGLYEFTTSGSADVQARLVDAAGATIAEQQDRPDDWNVQLAARLTPAAGDYRLELSPTGTDEAATRVAMRAIAEREEPPLALPGSRDVRPGDDVSVIPLAIPAGLPLLVLRAAADETVGFAVDHGVGDSWTTLRSEVGRTHALELPIVAPPGGQPAARYRLRLWSLDRRGSPIRLAAAAVAPPRIAERDLVRGAPVPRVAGAEPPVAVAEIALERPGLLRFEAATPWRAAGHVHQPLLAAESTASHGTSIWVATDLAAGAREATLRGARVALTADVPVSLDFPADGTPVACDVEAHRPGPLMVTASAAAGRPAVIIVPRDQVVRAGAAATPTATVGERAATALIDTAGPATALLWRADPAQPAARATLRLFEFARLTEEKLSVGPARGTLDSAGARRFVLPLGDKRLRLALGRGLAAALVRGGRTESAHDAGAGTLEETVETAAEALVLVNAGIGPAPWSIEILPLDARERSPAVTAGAPRIGRFAAAGTARIPVAPDSGGGAPLHLRTVGSAGLPTFLASDGRILTGDTIAVGAGGELLLPHGRGLAAVWVERPGENTSGLWGDAPPPREQALGSSGVLPLAGPSAGLTADVPVPAILRLNTDDPLLVVIRRPDGSLEDFVQAQPAPLDLYLAPGATSIWLRAPAGGELRGSAAVLLSPVTAIGEGPGPELLLAPGAAHYFSFNVGREGPVGIGVRAAPDTASCRLLDAAGRTIGDGVVQMSHLAPGSYLLAVRAPADGGPVTVRPALAGIDPPGSGPPEEIVRRYLRLSASASENEDAAVPAPQAPGPEEGD